MTKNLGGVRLCIRIRHCVFSFLCFGLRTMSGRCLGGRVLAKSLSPFGMKVCLWRVVEASILLPMGDRTDLLPW